MNQVQSWWKQFYSQGGCWWLVAGAALGFIILAGFLLAGPLLLQPSEGSYPNPVLTVVAYPTASPTPTSSATPDPTDIPTPTGTPPPAQGGFQQGQLVEINGTEGDGLRLREGAGLHAEIRMVAVENEVFEVSDGPIEQDGYIWWFLVNPYDNSKRGWGVSNFLRSAEG